MNFAGQSLTLRERSSHLPSPSYFLILLFAPRFPQVSRPPLSSSSFLPDSRFVVRGRASGGKRSRSLALRQDDGKTNARNANIVERKGKREEARGGGGNEFEASRDRSISLSLSLSLSRSYSQGQTQARDDAWCIVEASFRIFAWKLAKRVERMRTRCSFLLPRPFFIFFRGLDGAARPNGERERFMVRVDGP